MSVTGRRDEWLLFLRYAREDQKPFARVFFNDSNYYLECITYQEDYVRFHQTIKITDWQVTWVHILELGKFYYPKPTCKLM